MRKLLFVTILMLAALILNAQQDTGEKSFTKDILVEDSGILHGKWLSMGQKGKKSLNFQENDRVDFNFGDDGTIELVSKYDIHADTIIFNDKEGVTCPDIGKYKVEVNQYYLSLNLIKDDCGGRVKNTMGFWVRADYENVLHTLNERISEHSQPGLYLMRSRIYLAIGKPQEAKSDLDYYIENAQPNARVYINRAGTRFPDDLDGIIKDCDKAIKLDPGEKNAYFLKGLALYGLDKKEEACQNFMKAIDLGFSVLRVAERHSCAEFWEKADNK
jgi:tetratricopeptide (TPR) repeat protein